MEANTSISNSPRFHGYAIIIYHNPNNKTLLLPASTLIKRSDGFSVKQRYTNQQSTIFISPYSIFGILEILLGYPTKSLLRVPRLVPRIYVECLSLEWVQIDQRVRYRRHVPVLRGYER